MTLQDQITNFVTGQLNNYRLGDSLGESIKAAQKCGSLKRWVQQEQSKVVTAGAAEMIVPGLYGLTMVVGVGYLLHKMAHISWGIGVLKDACPFETEENSDLEQILTDWANDSKSGLNQMSFLPLGLDVLAYAGTEEGKEHLSSIESTRNEVSGYSTQENPVQSNPSSAPPTDRERLARNTISGLSLLTARTINDPKTKAVIQTISTSTLAAASIRSARSYAAKRAAQQATNRFVTKSSSKIAAKTISKTVIRTAGKSATRGLSEKMAARVAEKFATRLGGKAALSFIPFVGAAVNAGLNYWTMNGITRAAIAYYDKKLTLDDLDILD